MSNNTRLPVFQKGNNVAVHQDNVCMLSEQKMKTEYKTNLFQFVPGKLD